MKSIIGTVIYALFTVTAVFFLFIAVVGVNEGVAFGFLKLAVGSALYFVGRDIMRTLKS